MSPKRIKQRHADFQKALERLKEALNEDPLRGAGVVLDGSIQRFEFTFELSWKLAKNILNYQGIEASNPRDVIKETFQQKLIEDGPGWIAMLDDRNKTSHVYDEKDALEIYKRVKDKYVLLFEEFLNKTTHIAEKD